jgi:hypothetical protein
MCNPIDRYGARKDVLSLSVCGLWAWLVQDGPKGNVATGWDIVTDVLLAGLGSALIGNL